MSALRGIAAVLAGVGKGMVARKEDDEFKARQAKLDARDEERFKREQDTYARADKFRNDMQAAGQAATVNEAAPTLNTGDGAKVYGMENGADIASSDARQFQRMAPEAPAPVQSQSFAVNGKAYDTREAMQKAATDYNAPEARNQRYQAALQANGKPIEALQMQNAVIDSQAKKMGLETAQLNFANDKANRSITGKMYATPDFWGNAANMVSETNLGGLSGVNAIAKPSADGKTISIVGTKDGVEKVLFTTTNDARGQQLFMQQLLQVDPIQKIKWLKEQADREEAAKAAAAKNALDERKVAVQEGRLGAMEASILNRSAGGRGNAGGTEPDAAFDPNHNFDQKKAFAVAAEQASREAEIAIQTPGAAPFDQGKRTQQLYQSMIDANARENTSRYVVSVVSKELRANRSDPAAYEKSYQAALKAGLDEKSLEGMGFKRPGKSPEPTPAPTPAAPPKTNDASVNKKPIQLLQPLYNMNAWRKKMQEESNSNQYQ